MPLPTQALLSASIPRSNTTRKAVDLSAEREKLTKLINEIKTLHSEIGTFESRALEHARTTGEKLKQTKGLVRRLKLVWGSWIEETFSMTRVTANVYVRIFKHWAQVQSLSGEERSIRGAIRLLRGIKREPRSKSITINVTDLIATAEKSGVPSHNPKDLQEFVNNVLRLAKITKTISLGTQERCGEL